MKRRVRKIANFFAFNLLFFALYLNFIHKDKAQVSFASDAIMQQQNTAAFSGTGVQHISNQADKKPGEPSLKVEPKNAENGTAALQLSIN
jgi:hypothetical protein